MGDETVLSAERARELVASNEVLVLDIRDDEQWHEKRVPGSRRAAEDDLDAALSEVYEERAVMIVCDDGKRSAELAERLREQGREAFCIEDGIGGWEREKLAMQPSEDPDDDVRL
jgi:rhodanese-related sulfurtransferase